MRLQGAGTREGKEMRKERKREKQQEELLGLGEVKVEGGEVVTAELVSEEDAERELREQREQREERCSKVPLAASLVCLLLLFSLSKR